MTITEALTTIRYVTDSDGMKTDVMIPLTAWETLLTTWRQLIESLEDQEDYAIFYEWLEKRTAGTANMIPLDTLEQELVADGLLPG